MIEKQYQLLVEEINNRDINTSLQHMEKAKESCTESLLWIDYLSTYYSSTQAKELLSGARSAMLESVAYIGLGFGRATITAIRTQIDLLLGFTYFCNHPEEWQNVQKTGSGFMLRTDIDKYHKSSKPNFQKKLAIVEESEKNSIHKLYRILSAHIHGQSPLTTPKSGYFCELLSSTNFLESLLDLQKLVDRCLSNYIAIVFLEMDISIPLEIEIRIKKQLSPRQRKVVFFEY